MEKRNIDFYSDFSSYKGCSPPGVLLPKISIPAEKFTSLNLKKEEVSNFDFLSHLCDSNLNKFKKYPDYNSYKKRLKTELNTLEELGFIDYILLNWDIINYCHENDIPTGPGRGSAAGSLVLFLIGVTKVNPIKYDLFFERFVSKSRARKIEIDNVVYLDGSLLADIDNDISYEHRQSVIKYIEKKYPSRTAKILTLNTLSGKLCIKECCKIAGNFSEKDANFISDSIPKEFGVVAKLRDAAATSSEFKTFVSQNKELFEISLKLEGLNKNTGVHPSGIAISCNEISTICPLQKTNDGALVTSYDMNWVAELMVKFDILGLRTLSAIHTTCDLLDIDPTDIDLDESSTYDPLQSLDCPHGLFQIEASANFSVCKKVKPRNLEELSAVIAIARPGAMSFCDLYKNYIETDSVQSVDPFFDDVLSYTGGIPLYQEQLMKMAVKVGFSLEESEQLRRIVGKKKTSEMPKWKKKIEQKVLKNNLPENVGSILWKVAEDSANYSFNKSHSISYAILAAWTAYLKFKHPKEFFLSLLRMTHFEPNPQDEITKISQELGNFGIELLPPDLTKSSMDFSLENNDIRYGLNSIKGISSKSLSSLKDFISSDTPNKYDIFLAAKESKLNIGILSFLIQAGALSSYKTNRARLVLEAQVFNLLTDREKRIFISIGSKYNYDILNSIHDAVTNNLKGDDNKPIMKESRFKTLKSKYVSYKKIYDQNKKYEKFANWYFEKTLLGFSYSSRLSECFGEDLNLKKTRDFFDTEVGSKNKYIGYVEDVFCRKSQKGNDYMKITFGDEVGSIDGIMVDGRDKKLTKYKSKSKIPEKNNIIICNGTKGEDILFLDELSIMDEKIFMKLSDLK
jgi:DNA polymerase III subunit alpha